MRSDLKTLTKKRCELKVYYSTHFPHTVLFSLLCFQRARTKGCERDCSINLSARLTTTTCVNKYNPELKVVSGLFTAQQY